MRRDGTVSHVKKWDSQEGLETDGFNHARIWAAPFLCRYLEQRGWNVGCRPALLSCFVTPSAACLLQRHRHLSGGGCCGMFAGVSSRYCFSTLVSRCPAHRLRVTGMACMRLASQTGNRLTYSCSQRRTKTEYIYMSKRQNRYT